MNICACFVKIYKEEKILLSFICAENIIKF